MKNLSEQEELYYELSDIAHEMKIRVSDLIIVAKELEFGEVKPDDLFTLSEAKQLIARYDEKQNEPEKVPEKKDKVWCLNRVGEVVTEGTVENITEPFKDSTKVLHVSIDKSFVDQVRSVRVVK